MVSLLFKVKQFMKDAFVKFLFLAKVEYMAPITGASFSFLAWCTKILPLISIAAALIGAAIGILSYINKRKLIKLEIKKQELEIQALEKQNA